VTNPFAAPAPSGDQLPPKEIVGQLLIARPLEWVPTVKTVNGDKDAIRCDVVVLTQQNLDGSYGIVSRDVLWFSGRIVGALKKQIGELVLARMTLGTGKPGQNAPYELQSAVEDAQAVAFAGQWLAQHPEFVKEIKAPTAPPTPAQAPIPQPAPVPQTAPLPTPATVAAVVPQIPQVPAAVPTPAPLPTAAPAPVAVPATPVAQPAAGQIDPAVLSKLSPEALAQLQQLAAQQAAAATA
jgi:hypothetical protein